MNGKTRGIQLRQLVPVSNSDRPVLSLSHRSHSLLLIGSPSKRIWPESDALARLLQPKQESRVMRNKGYRYAAGEGRPFSIGNMVRLS
jgi:hypothetical protein